MRSVLLALSASAKVRDSCAFSNASRSGDSFAAGAAAMPLWLRAVARWGLAPSWLAGMALAVASFAGAAALGPGDGIGFTLICIGSGVALGADLALPGALLAGVIAKAAAPTGTEASADE